MSTFKIITPFPRIMSASDLIIGVRIDVDVAYNVNCVLLAL